VPDVSGLTNGLKNTRSAIEFVPFGWMYGGDLIIVERRVTFRSGSDVAIGSERLCDLLGEERAERDACDPPDNFADQGTDVMG
jgi:hypothetical protein